MAVTNLRGKSLAIIMMVICLACLCAPLAAQIFVPFNPFEPLPYEQAVKVREIYERGQQFGNRMDVFSKVGDSLTVSSFFFRPIGEGFYYLADYKHLQAVIDTYSVTRLYTGNSFANKSIAAGIGWAAAHALDPRYNDPILCDYNEMPLVCEYRLNKPAMAFIMFGTNDVGYVRPSLFRSQMQRIIDISSDMGVIPILSTIPPQFGRPEKIDQFNTIIRDLTKENHLPLWDYYLSMNFLDDGGISEDGLHPSAPPEGYAFAAHFYLPYANYGYVVRNLTGLQMLYRIWSHLQTIPKIEGL